MANTSPITLEQLFRFNRGLPHQLAAISELEADLKANGYAVAMRRDRPWFQTWSQAGKQPEAKPVQLSAAVRLTPSSPFSLRITPHITYGEFAKEQEARRFDAQHQCDTAVQLAKFIEKARTQFGGKPAIITSGYRPPAVNRSVGGASGSEHLYDAPGVGAVDFYIDGVDVYQLQAWADRNWPYSLGYGAPKGFIHVGMRQGKPRVRWNY